MLLGLGKLPWVELLKGSRRREPGFVASRMVGGGVQVAEPDRFENKRENEMHSFVICDSNGTLKQAVCLQEEPGFDL